MPWRLTGVVWAACVALGFVLLAQYDNRPGARAEPSDDWPATSRLERNGATMLLFAHPECPCTRATFGELDRLLTRVDDTLSVQVLFVGAGTTLRKVVARMSRVTVHDDPGGFEARQFGATTSGHTLLFAADGTLLYHGGITRSRGHHGDSLGQNAVLAHLRGKRAPSTGPVFGCPLFGGDE